MRVSLEHRIEDFENIVEELAKRAKSDAEAGKNREVEARTLFENIRLVSLFAKTGLMNILETEY